MAAVPVVIHVGGGTPTWLNAVISAASGLAGAIGGVFFTGRNARQLSEAQSKVEERRRLQDARRDSYGDAVSWLIGLRDQVRSVVSFQEMSVELPHLEGARSTARDSWATTADVVLNGLPEAMRPVLRVASDKVLESYMRLVATITFWPTSFREGTLTADLTRDVAELEGPALMAELEKRWRPVPAEELERMKLDSARQYLKQLDDFIHLLRNEVGLTTGSDTNYLSPEPEIPDSYEPKETPKLYRFGSSNPPTPPAPS